LYLFIINCHNNRFYRILSAIVWASTIHAQIAE
jgi:hypothetical protein